MYIIWTVLCSNGNEHSTVRINKYVPPMSVREYFRMAVIAPDKMYLKLYRNRLTCNDSGVTVKYL